MWKKLTDIKIDTSTKEGDTPAKIFKIFAAYLAEPMTSILNCSIKTCQYPHIWKVEYENPIPKEFPTSKLTHL